MKALILSCSTGQGHNACADALRETFEARGASCCVVDSLAFISPGTARFVSRGHVFLYRRLPALFGIGYRYGETNEKLFQKGSVLERFFRRGAAALGEALAGEDWDTVICTHPFSALMLTQAMEGKLFAFSTAFVATDYTCSPGVKASRLDYYFIPDAAITAEFVCPQIAEGKIVPSGIPIRRGFYEKIPRVTAKESRGVPTDRPHLVISCGSMGCGPIRSLAKKLAAKPSPFFLTAVCGTNQRLYRSMKRHFAGNASVSVLGYEKDMASLIASADLYLTKPGGISVTEAAAKGVPMAFVSAVEGCEMRNRNFFVSLGAAMEQADPERLRLLAQTQKTETFSADTSPLATFGKRCAAETIYQVLSAKG